MNVININALGRTLYLGQLYDAKTNTLLDFNLYKLDDIKPRQTDAQKTTISLHEIKSFSDRANSLGVSAQLSVSVMGGAISVGGGGSYLNSKQDTTESKTVAIIAQYRTTNRSLDLTELNGKIALTGSELSQVRATHVVTSITYGANVIGTLTQKSTNKEDTRKIESNISLETFKGFGQVLSAESRVEFTKEIRETTKASNLHVELAADINLGDQQAPTDPKSMFEFVTKSASLVGDGVPCEVSLTSLTMLMSEVPTVRELDEADLISIRTVYNKILKLENSRAWLLDTVEARGELFPTFVERIRTNTISAIVQKARGRLRAYLESYRSATSDADKNGVEKPANFVDEIETQFKAEITKYEADKDEWRKYEDRLTAAERHGYPVIGVSAVGAKMDRTGKGMLAAVLVPDNANWEALMNLYNDFADDIRQWRQSIDNKAVGTASVTEYVSIYADPMRDMTLESLDKTGTLKDALKYARDTKGAVFLTYGRSRSHLGGFVWHVLNKEGWGILIDHNQKWRYIGDVHRGKPHGSGVMKYVNNTTYAGDFVYGQRDGVGKTLDAEGKEVVGECGVFIKNVLDSRGVMVEVTVMDKDNVPVQYGSVALNKFAAVHVHVDRIATVMEWEEGQKFRLVLDGGKKQVDVVGSMIAPEQPFEESNPFVGWSAWPLGGGAHKVMARAR